MPFSDGELPDAQAPSDKGKLVLLANRGQLEPIPIHPAMKATPNARVLLNALRKRWLPALVLGFHFAAAIGTAVWFLVPPPKSMARSLVSVSSTSPRVFFNPGENNKFDMIQRAQVSLVKSRFVLNSALRQADVAKLDQVQRKLDPVPWLEKEIKVDFSTSPEIMRISLEGDIPDELVTIVNAVTRAYLDELKTSDSRKKAERFELLRKLQSTYEEKIQTKKQALKELTRAAGSGNTKTFALGQQIALHHLAVAKGELVKWESENRRLQVKIMLHLAGKSNPWKEFSSLLYGCPASGLPVNLALAGLLENEAKQLVSSENEVPEIAIEDYLKKDAKIVKYLAQVSFLEGRIRAEKNSGTPASSAFLRGKQKELEAAQKTLKDEKEKLRPRALQEVRRQAYLKSQEQAGPLKNEKAFVDQLLKKLADDVKFWAGQSNDFSESSVDVESFREDISRWEADSQKIARELDVLHVEQGAPPRVNLLEDAVVYNPDRNLRQLMLVGVFGVGAFGLVLFGIAFLEYRSRKVGSPEDLVHDLGIKLMGTLPDFNYRPRLRLLPGKGADPYWENLLADSVDKVRTLLLFATREEKRQAIMVTSAVSGEGKTSFACHLAASLARSGRKTLLVDCDLRNPFSHRLFDLDLAPGFSELLRAEKTMAEVIRPTHVDGLFSIPAGRGDLQAIQALALERTANLFKEIREQFEFIVIDSSPVLPVPDSLLIAQQADAVIFSTLREVSRIPHVYAAYQRLAMLGDNIRGAVVNGTRDEVYSGSKYPYVVHEE